MKTERKIVLIRLKKIMDKINAEQKQFEKSLLLERLQKLTQLTA